MNRTTSHWRLVLIAGLAMGAAACAPTKLMISNDYVPNQHKVARSLLVPVATNDDEADISHYYIEICDFETTETTKCNTTLVLENITNFEFQ